MMFVLNGQVVSPALALTFSAFSTVVRSVGERFCWYAVVSAFLSPGARSI